MKLTINGKQVETKTGVTILEVAKENGIHISTLCHLKGINEIAACRVCIVEVKGMINLVPACSTKATEGMEIITDNEKVRAARRKTLELICSNHNMDCTECSRGINCELRELCKEYEVDDRAYGIGYRESILDDSSVYLIRDNTKCILCRRCMSTCRNVQGVNAIFINNKAYKTNIGFGIPLIDTNCVGCGQCILACPTGALAEKDNTKLVWKAIFNKNKYVVAAVSPYTYWRLGELFGEAQGTNCSGKIAEVLRKIGFDVVYDAGCYEKKYMKSIITDAEKLINDGGKTVILGFCPSGRKFIENFYPQYADRLLPSISNAEAFAGYCKSELKGKDVFFVSIDNCLSNRGDENIIDASITTRELFAMIRRSCVSSFTADKVWSELEGEEFDTLPGLDETFIPTIHENFSEKEVTIGGINMRTVEVTGLSNARSILENGKEYDFIQVYACPGGCYNGGGAPHILGAER